MARTKCCVRGPSSWPTDPPRTFPGVEGHHGSSATALRPSTATVKENDKAISVVGNATAMHVQDLIRRPPPQLPAVHVKTEQYFIPARVKTEQYVIPAHMKTEQDFIPAVEEKRSVGSPVSTTIFTTTIFTTTIFSTIRGEDQQDTATSVWPGTLAPAKEELGHGAGRQIRCLSDMIRMAFRSAWVMQRKRARFEKKTQSVSAAAPASRMSIFAVTDVVKKPRAANGLQIPIADLVSEGHLLLKEKAAKLGVSLTLLKKRRIQAGLGRWPGRRVRAEKKRAEAQARSA